MQELNTSGAGAEALAHQPKSVLGDITIDPSTQPMFFGNSLAIQRFDLPKYPVFSRLFDKQRFFFWGPETKDLTNDIADFAAMSEAEQFVFIKNLQYQTLMDSVIARGIDILKSSVTLPEMEACFQAWAFFEVIHSYSYTYILKGIIPDKIRHVFDTVLQDAEIVSRANSIKREFDDLLNAVGDNKEKQLLVALVSTNIMEGIRFYVSFACSFAFAEPPSGKMAANAAIIKEICRDENLHVEVTTEIIDIIRTKPEEGLMTLWEDNKELFRKMFFSAAQEEKLWAKYLMSKGAVFGLSEKALCGYIEWLTNLRSTRIGLGAIFPDAPTSNPIGTWLDKWLNPTQVAPQELTIESYRLGATVSDIGSSDILGKDLLADSFN